MKHLTLYFLLPILTLLISQQICAQPKGEVLIVLGSDTAIWDGMSTGRYNCSYNPALYIDPNENAAEVMSPSFRNNMVDSYGQTMKLTWWMMAGNIFRYAVNTDVPIPNIMTLYLMRKYYLPNVEEFGDELTLHYHTFAWTDYNNDGISYWNQAKDFLECKDDFDFTLAQFLLEEKTFPVSFRSGWHYMDNNWQHYLNELLPYSMHNDYPHKRYTEEEPIGNVYDWSLAPAEWIPYRPSHENYQIPGTSRGWNLRSMHLRTSISVNIFEYLFAEANKGKNQMGCFWGHLPEDDFNDNLVKIDELLHQAEQKYPGVKFRYCSAVEAMQRWIETNDKTSPQLTIEEIPSGKNVKFRITTDENIFQYQPFVTVKTIYEDYQILRCSSIGPKTWETNETLGANSILKVGAAICDYAGNQSIEIKRYFPDDLYIDNLDLEYEELNGPWITNTNKAWGIDSRTASIQPGDSVRVSWNPEITKTGFYNISIQVPSADNAADEINFKFYSDNELISEIKITDGLAANDWNYIGTVNFQSGVSNKIEMLSGQAGKWLLADVIKISPAVLPKSLVVENEFIDLGSISELGRTEYIQSIGNNGYEQLTVESIESINSFFTISNELPITIEPMSSVDVVISIEPVQKGIITDTLVIKSDDNRNPVVKIPISASVVDYFKMIDNEDEFYTEVSGEWHYSVAQAYKSTSRYSFLSDSPGARAEFHFTPLKSGVYQIEFIVPSTVNAANNALYTVSNDDSVVDSLYIDQNEDSGAWVKLGQYYMPASSQTVVSVINDGSSTKGAVLRTDGMAFRLIEDVTVVDTDENVPNSFHLYQNYPNPFNPSTTIRYSIPINEKRETSNVKLVVYDILGNEIATLVNETKAPGTYEVIFNAGNLPSGVYFYKLQTGNGFSSSQKLILLK